MGLLDSVDLDELAKKVLASYTAKQDNSPLTSGLLAAGLGILANNRGNAANAIGSGGLLGLQAYTQGKQAQQKDPAQLISTLSGLQGLQQMAQDQRAMDAWQAGLGNVQPSRPAYGMQDRSMGMLPTPMQSQADALSPGQLESGLRSPSKRVQDSAKLLYETIYKPFELSPGQQRYSGGANPSVVAENIDPMKPRYANGQVSNIPGQVAALAEQEAAKAAATEGAKAAADVIQIPDGKGGMLSIPRAQALQLLQQVTQPAAQAPAGNYATPSGMRAAVAGAPIGDAPVSEPEWVQSVRRGLAGSQVGRSLSKAEEAGAVQGATIEGDIRKNLAERTNEADRKMVTDALTKAQSAYDSNQTLAKVRELSVGPNAARGGLMAPTLQSVDAFLNGVGIPFNAAQFKTTEEAQTYLAGLSLAQVKAMVGSQNISDRDVAAVKAMMPQIVNNPAVRLKIIDTLEAANDRHISTAKRMDEHLRSKGNLGGFDYGMKTSGEERPAKTTTLLDSLLEEAKRRGLGR